MAQMETHTESLIGADELLASGPGRRELIRGEVIEMTPAGGRHGEVAGRIFLRIAAFVEAHQLGVVYAAETGFILERSPDTVRAPDVAYVQANRVVDTPSFLPMAPDLVVEVVSPSDSFTYVTSKARMWLKHGTRLVWIVDPQSEWVQVHRAGGNSVERSGQDELSGGEVLPGLVIKLTDIF